MKRQKKAFPDATDVFKALDKKLSEMKASNEPPDVITYAGNGEPTLHPEFTGIIDDSIILRDKYFPKQKLQYCQTPQQLKMKLSKKLLLKVDKNILKLDSALIQQLKSITSQKELLMSAELIEPLHRFNGKVIIQTLFLRGTYNGKTIDNTTPC